MEDKLELSNETNYNVVRLLYTDGEPQSISVSEHGQVLVVTNKGELAIYSGQGKRSKFISLEKNNLKDPLHVIQSSSDTYLYRPRYAPHHTNQQKVEETEEVPKSS